MIKFFVSIYKNICEFFDRYFVVITLIVGSFCLYYGIKGDSNNLDIKRLLHTIGSLSLASGIFAGIAKSNQFTEIYKKILRDIIYADEHLEVRKDLETIWENVTQTLSNRKFMKISNLMRQNIKKYFLPLDHDYYYDNYKVDLNIEFLETNTDYITIKETTSYTIICDDEELLIDNRHITGIKLDFQNKGLTKYSLVKLSINNENITNLTCNQKEKNNHLLTEFSRALKGKKTYTIVREEEKQYNINHNPIRKHLAVWIYNNCSLDVMYPKNLTIDFHNMGVLNEFTKEDKGSSSYNRIKADYKGLIYKNQGFFLHFRKN